ncbi:unnamed protein product [Urochloa decumbens]|uniref:Flavin-containing monooxygenase n=1 Tax=Urochloa decumbens TaxID=240449 RepID=A0ABC9FEY8_9POAL
MESRADPDPAELAAASMDHKQAAKRVAVVGAGTSGLAACKHLLARGFRPVVFEAGASLGGLWTRTLASTRLQSPNAAYRFSDFPCPEGADTHPRHDQAVEYLAAYARRFGVEECVRFRSQVVAAEFVGADGADTEMWAGNGEAFGGDGAGRWSLTVRRGKSAVDITAECADANGAEWPCTMVFRSPQWLVHGVDVWGKINLGYLYTNRFAQLMVRKPGAGLASSILATLLSPLAWLISKVTEAYYKKAMPMREYGMEPEIGFATSISSCKSGMLPDAFYDRVRGGSFVIRRSRAFSFCEDGLVLDAPDGGRVIPADVVILATGFRGDQKLRDMFVSSRVKDIVVGSSGTTIPLYRESVHPRIPQMAVIGYSESLTNIYTIEMMAKWVARLLDGAFRLPSVRRMEQSVAEWGRYMRRSNGDRFRRSCLGAVNIWYNDELCRDMGCDPRRKKGLLAEWFQPYGAVDYADIQ